MVMRRAILCCLALLLHADEDEEKQDADDRDDADDANGVVAGPQLANHTVDEYADDADDADEEDEEDVKDTEYTVGSLDATGLFAIASMMNHSCTPVSMRYCCCCCGCCHVVKGICPLCACLWTE